MKNEIVFIVCQMSHFVQNMVIFLQHIICTQKTWHMFCLQNEQTIKLVSSVSVFKL